jgi:hypothetical protein
VYLAVVKFNPVHCVGEESVSRPSVRTVCYDVLLIGGERGIVNSDTHMSGVRCQDRSGVCLLTQSLLMLLKY